MTARISSSAAPISAVASRDRAAERVTVELGPRSEREIQSALEKEVGASAGPASIVPYATSRTTVLGLPTSVLARRILILS